MLIKIGTVQEFTELNKPWSRFVIIDREDMIHHDFQCIFSNKQNPLRYFKEISTGEVKAVEIIDG